MRKLFFIVSVTILLAACNTKTNSGAANASSKDTLKYAYKATYSSDITVPGNPLIAQKVLQVWKMFETANIQAMKPYFADSVKYDDAGGMHFYGRPTSYLLMQKRILTGLIPCVLTLRCGKAPI